MLCSRHAFSARGQPHALGVSARPLRGVVRDPLAIRRRRPASGSATRSRRPRTGHGKPYAQLWFARFDGNDPSRTFGFSRSFDIGAAAPRGGAVPPAHRRRRAAQRRHAKGQLAGDENHDVEWDLQVDSRRSAAPDAADRRSTR